MNVRRISRTLALVVIAASLGTIVLHPGCRDWVLEPAEVPTSEYLEISFRINDPVRYPDDEPLSDPQTVIWLEDRSGRYVQSLLVSDWTAMGGWKKKRKTPT